jgi:hypothetical protein
MGLNDEAEKLRYAWEQINTAVVDSEAYNAAYEYLDEEIVVKHFQPEEWKKLIEIDTRRWREAQGDGTLAD